MAQLPVLALIEFLPNFKEVPIKGSCAVLFNLKMFKTIYWYFYNFIQPIS